MKVAEPQNGENIEQRAGGVSPGTGELCTRAEKVPRAERVSFEDGGVQNFLSVESFGGFEEGAWLPRQGRTARQHHRHRSIFSISHSLLNSQLITFWN